MSQTVVVGPRQRSFHRSLLGLQEFDQLSDTAKDDLLRLSSKDRLLLSDAWEPEGANVDAAFGGKSHLEPINDNFLKQLEDAWAASGRNIVFQPTLSDNGSKVRFHQGHKYLELRGLDNRGNQSADFTVVLGDLYEGEEKQQVWTPNASNLQELLAVLQTPMGGADFVFNQSKGRWVEKFYLPLSPNDALIADLVKASGIEVDETFMDRDTWADITSGTTVKCDATNYVRKVVTSGINQTVIDTAGSNWVTSDLASDLTWTALGGATNNSLGGLVMAYRPASGSAESAILPTTKHDFVATTDGTDMIATVNNFARAA